MKVVKHTKATLHGSKLLSSSPQTGDLRLVDEHGLAAMKPGDLVLLAETESLRTAVESIFFAVLACPACGTLGLITSAQYYGNAAVTCGSRVCSCRFRIAQCRSFVFLPAN
jgi:hypothetical protein